MPDEGRRDGLDRRRTDSVAIQIARFEQTLATVADDVKDVKASATDGLRILDQRVRMLEDVRVRALEDWRMAEKVREDERKHQQEVQERQRRHSITRKEFWIAIGLIAATLLAAVIAGGGIHIH